MDLLLDHARIVTGASGRPRATRLAIRDGRVAGLDDAAPPGGQRIDAGGGTVLPGLVDAHLHLLQGGLGLAELDLSGARTPEAFADLVAGRHRALPRGRWLVARGWSSTNLPRGAAPHRSWLAAAGDRPVVCRRSDLHAVLVNDAVLSRIDTRADPPGGRIERDASGAPTGILVEAAAWDLVVPLIPEPDAAARRDAVLAAQAHLHALGITAVGAMETRRDVESVLVPLRERLTLRCRITHAEWTHPPGPGWAASFENDERLAVIGCKAFLDGTFGSRTAAMSEDWADDPGNRGLLQAHAAPGTLEPWAAAVAGAGLSPALHAIGDVAVARALDAAAAVGGGAVRVEHAQHVHPRDLPRFAGVIASMQPLHKADDGRALAAALGPRARYAFPFRSLLDAGARLAFGSDWPVVSPDPLAGVRAAVTGLTHDGEAVGVEQNLTAAEALAAYTTGAARALRIEGGGALSPGGPGDLVLLDRDPFAADWVADPPRVLLTVAGGRVVYDGR